MGSQYAHFANFGFIWVNLLWLGVGHPIGAPTGPHSVGPACIPHFTPVSGANSGLPTRTSKGHFLRGDISRNWRGTSTPTAVKICGKRFKLSEATKAGAPLMCKATLPDELNTFYAHFDPLIKESAVKFILSHPV